MKRPGKRPSIFRCSVIIRSCARKGARRICVVEIEGARNLPASCVTPVAPGMVVRTNTPAVRARGGPTWSSCWPITRRIAFTCERNNNCELQALARDLGIKKVEAKVRRDPPPDNPVFPCVRDPNNACSGGRCEGLQRGAGCFRARLCRPGI